MKLFQKLVCMALTATATASLSICAFAADYTFDTAADTDYYPSTSYEDTYGTAYHYGSKNLVDYQIPNFPTAFSAPHKPVSWKSSDSPAYSRL